MTIGMTMLLGLGIGHHDGGPGKLWIVHQGGSRVAVMPQTIHLVAAIDAIATKVVGLTNHIAMYILRRSNSVKDAQWCRLGRR
jgi:hypothetical protein